MILKIFNKKELLLILVFLLIIYSLFYISIIYSRMRERDLARQKDLTAVQNALTIFHRGYRFYPPSDGGYIQACAGGGSDFSLGLDNLTTQTSPYDYFKSNAN